MIASYLGLEELLARTGDHSLGMQAVRVLLAMMAECDYENRVRGGQKDLARKLGMNQAHVSRAIRDLIECGFVENPHNDRGRYLVSPKLCWKGDEDSLRQALSERNLLSAEGYLRAA
jgi:DNA-binding MarR family transcriptional regulator